MTRNFIHGPDRKAHQPIDMNEVISLERDYYSNGHIIRFYVRNNRSYPSLFWWFEEEEERNEMFEKVMKHVGSYDVSEVDLVNIPGI